jgi:hypothetical protein
MIVKDSSINTSIKEKEILPLLSAKEANKLANTGTKEMELQKVADLIRSRAEQFYFDLQVKDLTYSIYIYKELIKQGYIVIHADLSSLSIMWKLEHLNDS